MSLEECAQPGLNFLSIIITSCMDIVFFPLSAWSLVRSKKLTISDLAKKSPNLFSFFIDNQFICHRLEIQG